MSTETVTFLFTDIEGSTQLWETHPTEMRADLTRHDDLLDAAFSRHGHVFKRMGDAFFAVYQDAPRAVEAALAAQQALLLVPWELGPGALRVRMALYTGEAQSRSSDYFGPALNRAARLLSAGHGGQVLLSQTTTDHVVDRLPDGAALRDLGRHRLKDLAGPEPFFQLLHPSLPWDFPRLRSLDALPNNLPLRLDNFIGRDHDLAEVKRLLDVHRLVTLTGVGGAGKTRLAQQAGAEIVEQYPDGVWLVSLESLADSVLVPQAIAAAVGIREQPGRQLAQTISEALAPRRLLLILDNCEHLVAACAEAAETLLQACPFLRILATSREALEIGGERIHPVSPLPVPDLVRLPSPQHLTQQYEAVHLFVDRAALSLPGFSLTPHNAPAVAQICRQLDGIPLAIELAAARVRMLTPEQISRRLSDRFHLLTGGRRTALPRQQTLRALIDWSYDLLSEPERELFRRVSVFAGGWTLEAAEHICAGEGLDETEVLDLLSSLVAKSLVLAEDTPDGEKRYRMLETLRQYCGEQLQSVPSVRDRERDWFLALAERAEPNLRGPAQEEWLNRLESEHDNLRAALVWATNPETRLRLASALHRFWLTRGYVSEGLSWLEGALAEDYPFAPALKARGLGAAGVLAWSRGDHPAALSYHARSHTLYQEIGDERGGAQALMNLGIVSDFQEDYLAAELNYQQSLAIYRALGDRERLAFVLVNLAAHFLSRDQPEAALPYLEECLNIRRALGDKSGIATALLCLGEVSHKQGNIPEARARFVESLSLRQEIGDRRSLVASLYHLACLDEDQGYTEHATLLLAGMEALRDGAPVLGAAQASADRLRERLMGLLGKETYDTLWQRGESMPLPELIQSARSQVSPHESSTQSHSGGIS